MSRFLFVALAAWWWIASAQAADVKVAVAANFSAPMQRIARLFEQQTGHKALLSFGGTGALVAQIRNGAPFQVLLAADDAAPAQLERDGLGVPGSRFTYATGRLVLWSAQPGRVDAQGAVLHAGRFAHIALANPQLAPYGAAAVEALAKLGVLDELQPKIVQGSNIGQTYQLVASGNAELGFVALSQVIGDGGIARGSGWIVPQTLHASIRQDALLLATGKDDPAATALLAFLRSDAARAVIRAYGYAL